MLSYDSISKAIQAHHLMTPIENAMSVMSDTGPASALALLRPFDFDQAPVVERDGTIIGFVTTEGLEAATAEHLPIERLVSDCLIAAETPFERVLGRFTSIRMAFVVEGDGITGFITPSDLNKHPARTHFYLLLADLEMTMASVARRALENPEEALDCLEPKRRRPIDRRHQQNRRHNVDADVLTAFEFRDLLTVTGKLHLYRRFGATSEAHWSRMVDALPDFRNDVMHPTREFIGSRTIPQLVGYAGILRLLLSPTGEAKK